MSHTGKQVLPWNGPSTQKHEVSQCSSSLRQELFTYFQLRGTLGTGTLTVYAQCQHDYTKHFLLHVENKMRSVHPMLFFFFLKQCILRPWRDLVYVYEGVSFFTHPSLVNASV